MLTNNEEDNKIILHLIEQKRNRKAVEHRIREQKQQSVQKSLEFMTGGKGKGPNPLSKLRGITEPDFF